MQTRPSNPQVGDTSLTNLFLGALAGMVGTLAMTAAMRRMHSKLPLEQQYPLPPREVTEAIAQKNRISPSEEALRSASLAAHFAYGAATGAAYGLLPNARSIWRGAAYGLAIWAASYLGWIPAARILRSPIDHPAKRSLLMIAAHLVWGGATAWAVGELDAARSAIFRQGPLEDRL